MKELLLVAGAALAAVVADLCVWFFRDHGRRTTSMPSPGLLVAIFILWLVAGFGLIDLRVTSLYEYPARIGFLAVSFVVLSYLGQRLDQLLFRYLALALLPLLTAVLLWQYAPPFRSGAWIAWAAALLAHFYVLRAFAAGDSLARAWHLLGIALTVLVLVLQLHWFIGVTTWENAAISLTLAALSLVCLYSPNLRIAEPRLYLYAAGLLAAGNLVFLIAVSIATDGDPMPLAYRALLNPYDVANVAALGVAALVIRSYPRAQHRLWLALAACTIVLTVLSAMRGFRFLG